MKNPKGLIPPLCIAIASGCCLAWIGRGNAALRDEQTRLHTQIDEAARLKATLAHARAASISDEQLRELCRTASQAAEIQSRIDRLKNESRPAGAPTTTASRQLDERWRNLGTGTPDNTLQSIIWAATGGEVDALISMITYDAEGRAAADELYARIPEDSRKLFPSADKLVASFIAGRLPTNFTDVKIVEQTAGSDTLVTAKVRLERSRKMNATREVDFTFQRTGSAWKLVIPRSVILEFGKSLKSE